MGDKIQPLSHREREGPAAKLREGEGLRTWPPGSPPPYSRRIARALGVVRLQIGHLPPRQQPCDQALHLSSFGQVGVDHHVFGV